MAFSQSMVLVILFNGMETVVKFTSTNLSFLMMSLKKTSLTLALQDSELQMMSRSSKDMVLQSTPTSGTMKFNNHMESKHLLVLVFNSGTPISDT